MFKSAILTSLLVVTAICGTFTTVGAQGNTEAAVEVRVWNAVADGDRHFISARYAGGSWSTLGTIPLPLDSETANGRFRYGDISLDVPLEGRDGILVEIRVWKATRGEQDVYISIRPEGGSWRELGTVPLPLDRKTGNGRFRYGDIRLGVPSISSPDVPITFWGDFSQQRQAEIRDETLSVVAYFTDRYGLPEPDIELHVGADDDSLTQARRDVLGIPNPPFLNCGEAVNKRVFILEWCSTRTHGNTFPLAQEYFKVLQTHLASSSSASASVVVADWLLEGTATYMAIEYAVAKSYFQRITIDSALLDKATSAPFDLRNAEADIWDGGGPYVAAFATGYLIRQTSAEQLMDFFRALPRAPGWREAFSQAFGMSTEAFYADFALHVEEQRTRLFQVVMRVLNPDGSHLDSAFVIARKGSVRQSRVVDPGSQRFQFSLPEGNYHFDVHATDCLAFGPGAAIAQMIARYPSEGRMEVHEDLEILVQLPDWPSELNINCSQRDRYAIRGTLVSTGDHDFTTYTLAARTPGLWGAIYLDASGAQFRPDASGSFEILVPDGYEYRIQLQNACREQVGWYMADRDVIPWAWEQATGVPVDGSDVTGIRIRLPEVIEVDVRCNQR